jgi:hypothetical protein
LLVLTGVLIFMLFTALSRVLLAHWHDAEQLTDTGRTL